MAETEEVGQKLDDGKLQWGLLPVEPVREVVRVLMFGARKYAPENWKKVPDWRRRYFEALQRHAWAWWEGERVDPEHGRHPLASVVCCALFLMWFELVGWGGGHPGPAVVCPMCGRRGVPGLLCGACPNALPLPSPDGSTP